MHSTLWADEERFRDPEKLADEETTAQIGFSLGSVIVAPIPFQSPTFGRGLALGGAYVFQSDANSDSSTIGFGGFRTDNDSEGYGIGATLNFSDNKWRVKFGYAKADLNYALYTNRRAVPIAQSLEGVTFGVGRSVSPALSFGAAIAYGETTIRTQGGGLLPAIFRRDRSLDVLRVSLDVEYDRRDDDIFPTQGSYVTGVVTQGEVMNGPGRSYTKAVLTGRRYISVLDDGVLAAQGAACATTSNAPFFDSCAIGPIDNFRGYESTEYIDDALLSLQVEYRGRFTKRLGYVAFAGAASVGDNLGDALDNDWQGAAGAGLRVRLSKKIPVDYAIDMSVNKDGDQLLYITVGQRF